MNMEERLLWLPGCVALNASTGVGEIHIYFAFMSRFLFYIAYQQTTLV